MLYTYNAKPAGDLQKSLMRPLVADKSDSTIAVLLVAYK
jgi:hypothetical protein